MMRKFLFLILFIPSIIFSLDYGLSIDETLSAGSTDISNIIKASLWTNLGGETAKIELRGTISHSTTSQPVFPYFMDIDILKFSTTIKSRDKNLPSIKLALGRYTLADQTGYVLAHKLDTLSLNFKYPALSLYTSFSYSGLIWKNNSGISPSILDAYYSVLDDVYLGSPRFIGITGISLPPIFRQKLSLEFLYQIDLREDSYLIEEYTKFASGEEEAIEGGGMLDTYYASAKLAGPIPLLPNLNYRISYVFNSGRSMSSILENLDYYEYSEISAHLAELRVDKYIPSFYNSVASYRFLFTTGDDDFNGYYEGNYSGDAENFVPVTRSSFGVAFSPSPGNLIVNDISFSLKPLKTLQTIVKGLIFTRTTTGPISEDGIDPLSNNLYLGSEFDIIANYRPLSDLGVSLSAGIYFPYSGTYSAAYLLNNTILPAIKLNVSFSM
eukprot:Anaeramoba_ignava/a480330_69.p2 GENE.a480330_69~~a480330_69.p2  ORF type:complete len:440 (-),score=-1.70 a480330_69:2527-3846(-)